MQKLVEISKILSDINRVKILSLIKREKSVCVCEICDTLNLSQPLVSRHLKQIRDAKLLQRTQSGKWISYSIQENSTVDYLLNSIEDEISNLPKLVVCSSK